MSKQQTSTQKEIAKLGDEFDKFDEQVKSLTMDRMKAAPLEETEPQTKISQRELERKKDIYLKPYRTINSREKFNDKYKAQYEFDKEYVYFTAENKEIIGEDIDLWTKPYAGLPAEWWKVPVNKPIWGPRYLAERIKGCKYHRMSMQANVINSEDSMGQYFGTMAVDSTVQRLDAQPANPNKSVFMGANNFPSTL